MVTKATLTDKNSGKFLKGGMPVSAKPISEVCNISMALRSFRDACKIVKPKPLFKKVSKTDLSNYRPIPFQANTIPTFIVQSYERIVLDQMHDFLSHNKILYEYQSSF